MNPRLLNRTCAQHPPLFHLSYTPEIHFPVRAFIALSNLSIVSGFQCRLPFSSALNCPFVILILSATSSSFNPAAWRFTRFFPPILVSSGSSPAPPHRAHFSFVDIEKFSECLGGSCCIALSSRRNTHHSGQMTFHCWTKHSRGVSLQTCELLSTDLQTFIFTSLQAVALAALDRLPARPVARSNNRNSNRTK